MARTASSTHPEWSRADALEKLTTNHNGDTDILVVSITIKSCRSPSRMPATIKFQGNITVKNILLGFFVVSLILKMSNKIISCSRVGSLGLIFLAALCREFDFDSPATD